MRIKIQSSSYKCISYKWMLRPQNASEVTFRGSEQVSLARYSILNVVVGKASRTHIIRFALQRKLHTNCVPKIQFVCNHFASTLYFWRFFLI
jgi:hypothetical protein